mmetsp:Transcript_1410/g.2031  ORF Transcript_1410/g.2031 Transcript_1410/m.2031 type:complete len:367 (+) Transcript_1410:34-1134(+)
MGDTSIDMPSVLVALVPKEEMIRTLSNKSQKSSSSMEDVTRTKVCKVKPQETTSSMCLKSEESNLNSPAEKDTQDLRVDSTSSCQQDSKIGASESNGTSSAEVIGPNSCNGENETSTSQESENCLKEHQDNNLPSIPSNNNNNNNRESTELSFENNGAKILKDVSSAQNSEEKKNAFLSLYRLRSDAEPGVCLICNKSQKEEPRAMVRFLPNPPDATEDITVHVFCGKTVAILPAATEKNEDLANYEIILKAGLKHKHGIGSKIDLAISRSRCALARGGEADNDSKRESKEYFLVQEFESHLKNIQEANGDEHVEVNGNRAKGRQIEGQNASYYNDLCGKSVAKRFKGSNTKETLQYKVRGMGLYS